MQILEENLVGGIFPLLREAILESSSFVINEPNKAPYDFVVLPIGERGSLLTPELLREVGRGLAETINTNFENFDYIVSPAPGGNMWGVQVALRLWKNLNILREETSHAPGEFAFERSTGYYVRQLYFNNFSKGDRVVLVDDVLSTTSTIDSILGAFKTVGVIPVGVAAIYAKSQKYKKMEEKYDVDIISLLEYIKK